MVSAQALTSVTDCRSLSSAGETYELNTGIWHSGIGACLTVAADNVILDCKGFSITGDDNSNSVGVKLTPSAGSYFDKFTVKNCRIYDFGYTGIYLNTSNNSAIINNTVGSTSYGIYVEAGEYSENLTITGNTLYKNSFGIMVTGGVQLGYVTIAGNNASSNTDEGIRLAVTHANVSNNVVTGVSHPLGIGYNIYSSYSTFTNNTATENIATYSENEWNIAFKVGGYNCTLIGNNVSGNTRGLVLQGDNLTLRNNTVDGNLVWGLVINGGFDSDNDIDTSNTVNGEALYYLNHKTDYVLENLVLPANTSGTKIYVVGSDNVTLRNIAIGNGTAESGVYVCNSNNSVISNVSVSGSEYGIQTWNSYNLTLTGNNFSGNVEGIRLSGCGITLRNNTADDNTETGLWLWDVLFSPPACNADLDIDASNTFNGEPVYYLYGKTDYVLENLVLDAVNTADAKIYVVNSDNVTLRNMVISNNSGKYGVLMVYSNNTVISNVTFSGFTNWGGGIYTDYYSTNTRVTGCSFTGNFAGIYLNSEGNTVEYCNLTGNEYGLYLGAGNQSFGSNNITGNSEYNLLYDGPETISWSLSSGGTSITYSGLNSTTGDISDAVWYASTGVAAVNASANNDLNTSAQITMTIAGQCPATLYYYNDFTTDLNTIIASGQLCNSTSTPACTIVSCSGNTVVFNVDHFDSYGGEGYDIPEFSQLAAMAALLLAAGGFALARKRK
ncbi:MAG: right-handed parallel beta-helix repeat-containing protein [Candidatus Micrarchaeota archaeon]|nr:right-handed parallel beta-helix repeat-containing protein [Candidatus Micrarchaeota archaeon]